MRTKIDIYDFIFDTLLHGSYLLRGLQSGSLIHIYRSLQVRFLQWRGTGSALSQFDQRLSKRGLARRYLLSAVHTTHCRFYREQHWAQYLLMLALVSCAPLYDNLWHKPNHHYTTELVWKVTLNTHKCNPAPIIINK